jgi:hypothetical protein
LRKKRVYDRERRGREHFFEPMEYVVGFLFINDIFFNGISIFGIITNISINFENKSFGIYDQHYF